MPIYSETLSDKSIVDLLGSNYKNILIIGCGACMNESLAYKNNTPIFIKNDLGEMISYSVYLELLRLTDMLSRENYTTRFELFSENSNSRCMINYGKPLHKVSVEFNPDIVLVLSCPSGLFGIKKVSENVPIIKITKQCGFLAYGYEDKNDGTRFIIKEKSAVIGYK